MINELISNSLPFLFDKPFTAIIGSEPSKGARSPLLWNSAYKKFSIDNQMYPLDVTEENLRDLLITLSTNEFFYGGAIAVPYKEKVVKILSTLENSRVSQQVNTIGAANAIYFDDEYNMCLTNTDGEAGLKTLIDNCPDLKNKNILIIGIGGAGKAVSTYISNFIDRGKLFISARNRLEVINFVNSLNAEYIGWPIENFNYKNLDVVINCTSLGSDSEESDRVIPLCDTNFSSEEIFSSLNKNCVLFDIIYTPLKTQFLKIGEKYNLKTLNGLQMNLDQAVIAFNYATKSKYKINEIRSAMKDAT